MENNNNTRQLFIRKMIGIIKSLKNFDSLNGPELEKEIKNQTEETEKKKKEEKKKIEEEQKRKGKDTYLIKEFDFYEVAIQNIIESTTELNLFLQKKIIIEVCQNCNKRKIKTENTNILSAFDMKKRYGNELNLEDFFAINKVKINCSLCKAKDSVKAETIFRQIPEYLIILFKNNDKKVIYPEINFSFDYIDIKSAFTNKRMSYDLKAVMIKENSNFSCDMIKNKRDLDKYKRNNPNFNIPLVLIYHKEVENLQGNNLKQDGTIIIELKKNYEKNSNSNININNNNNPINNQNIYNNNNIQNFNQKTQVIINSAFNNNQNNNNNINNNKINNFQGNNNQIYMNNNMNSNMNYNMNYNMNMNMNNNMYNNMNNNMNNNVINNNYNQNNIIQNQNQNNTDFNFDGIVCLIFTFPAYKKDIYIDIGENEKFSKVIDELKEKYMWLNKLKDLQFFYKNKKIDNNKTVKENGLDDSNKIVIKFKDE